MYIDLVLCRHNETFSSSKKYLFRAPAWSGLKEGEQVICETNLGKNPAKVISVFTADEESDAFKFAVKCCGAKLPLAKIVSKIEYTEFKYEEGEKTDE